MYHLIILTLYISFATDPMVSVSNPQQAYRLGFWQSGSACMLQDHVSERVCIHFDNPFARGNIYIFLGG